MSKLSDIKEQYKSSLKSMDTEETLDLMFYRPIGYMWALLCARLGITPNAITIASIFLGVAGGILFYFGKTADLWLNYVGMLLLVWANSFDSADGQLARMTKQYSRLGRILDGMSGDFWFVAIYVAICFRVNEMSEFFMQYWGGWIWIMAVLAGGYHAKQAAMADYYRQFHLYFLKGEEGSELDSASKLRQKLAALSWSRNFWQKLTLSTYTNYTVQQEATAPTMQRLRAAIAKRFPDGHLPQDFRDDFRKASLPLMKYTNILSFNWRCIALFISLFLKMPWLYFAFELIVLNSLLVYMVVRHEKICRRFVRLLDEGKY